MDAAVVIGGPTVPSACGGAALAPNPALVGFRSLAGGPLLPVADYSAGDPGAPSAEPTSVAAVYAPDHRPALPPTGARMARWAEWLPFRSWTSLGEGGTAAIPLPWLAQELGLGGSWMKAEWTNPTGSHKDRMTPLALARARMAGARGVACASTGNAALSLGAYAAVDGMPCRIVTTAAMSAPLRRTLLDLGAGLEDASDALARWHRLRVLAREGWYPVTNFAFPPVGSSPWGIEGYKTVAFELAGEPGGPLDAVLVPVARGDLLWGIGAGFAALAAVGQWPHPLPRLFAVEPFPRLTRVLAGNGHVTDTFPGRTRQASVSGATLTDQTLHAVRDTGGGAVVVDDDAAFAARADLARHGLALELCAAATVGAARLLRADGRLPAGARVAVIGTAAGWFNLDA